MVGCRAVDFIDAEWHRVLRASEVVEGLDFAGAQDERENYSDVVLAASASHSKERGGYGERAGVSENRLSMRIGAVLCSVEGIKFRVGRGLRIEGKDSAVAGREAFGAALRGHAV